MRLLKRISLIAVDVAMINVAAIGALYLRFELSLPARYLDMYLKAAPFFTVISVAIFSALGLYSVILKYVSIDQLLASFFGTCFSVLALWGGLGLRQVTGYPRSAFIITGVLEFIFLAGLRLSVRLVDRVRKNIVNSFERSKKEPTKVLIVGAGDAGAILGRELTKPSVQGYSLVGYIDDDALKKNTRVNKVKVFGNRHLIPEIVREIEVDEIIIAMPSVPPRIVKDIVKLCQSTSAKIKALPKVIDMASRPFDIGMIKEIDIEDLLSRPEVSLDTRKIRSYLHEKIVLVTGAGGSIGLEICRQVARYSPRTLILLGHGENSIFEANLVLDAEFPGIKKELVIADVRDFPRIKEVFAAYQPEVVFHAAAHKHVPLMEANVQEAVKTNIFGTLNVAKTAVNHNVEKFVMISTDKAVNPTSAMGASKRVAELVIQSMNGASSSTQFVSVRFGNVLGSRGSVVPIFRRQIAQGGPVTVTHPEMCRYFMTKKEAVQLVLQAGTMGKGGEVFVLDMGEPVLILEMAEQMIRLSGRIPYTEIPIVFTGIRPGEKLYEEILTAEEGASATHHSQIFVAKQQVIDDKSFHRTLKELRSIVYPEGETSYSNDIYDHKFADLGDADYVGTGELAAANGERISGMGEDEAVAPSGDLGSEKVFRLLKRLVPEFSNKTQVPLN